MTYKKGEKTEYIKDYIRWNPSTKTKEIASTLDVSKRMVRYVKEEMKKGKNGGVANILFVDVETSPMEVLVWGLYKQRIPVQNVIKDWALLSWSAKWLGVDDVMSERVTTEEAHERQDVSIMQTLWELFDKADIVVAHNANRFDVRKIKARFIENGYPPTSSFNVIDTLKVSQRNFAFSSHKLNYLTSLLDIEDKTKTSFNLWKRCINGDNAALNEMREYNKQDVVVLEELYLVLRPWIKSHANISLLTDGDKEMCANCGGTHLDWKYFYHTTVNSYPSYRCLDCGAIGRSRFSKITKEKRKTLTVSVAR